MKKICTFLGLIILVVSIVYGFIFRFQNVDMTEMRFAIECWWIPIPIIIGYILIQIGISGK